jgi:octaprenyl-diphosphate synthase
MPTLNSLFSHQISVIMGDFLYSSALTRLVSAGNLDALRAAHARFDGDDDR